MTCWQRKFQNEPDLSGMNDLLKALTSSSALALGALHELLMSDVPGFSRRVPTRIAVDGHDVEVQQENGIWRVLNPNDITLVNQPRSEPLALEASKQQERDVMSLFTQQLTEKHYLGSS